MKWVLTFVLVFTFAACAKIAPKKAVLNRDISFVEASSGGEAKTITISAGDYSPEKIRDTRVYYASPRGYVLVSYHDSASGRLETKTRGGPAFDRSSGNWFVWSEIIKESVDPKSGERSDREILYSYRGGIPADAAAIIEKE
jgi:hypothetical protein